MRREEASESEKVEECKSMIENASDISGSRLVGSGYAGLSTLFVLGLKLRLGNEGARFTVFNRV